MPCLQLSWVESAQGLDWRVRLKADSPFSAGSAPQREMGFAVQEILAEGAGFEPARPEVCRFSRPVDSAALPPLRFVRVGLYALQRITKR